MKDFTPTIQKITAEETYTLRKNILRKGIENPTLSLDIDEEKDSYHWGYFVDNECVGVLSAGKRNLKNLQGNTENQKNAITYQLRGMAVSETFQAKGIGTQLLIRAEEDLRKEKQVQIIWCNAREKAVDFYLKNGFEVVSEAFEVPEIGTHFVMLKTIE